MTTVGSQGRTMTRRHRHRGVPQHRGARRRARLLAGLALSVLALAGGALLPIGTSLTGAQAARRAETRTAAPACPSSALVVWLDTTASGTAGSFYYDLELTNLSGHACTLTGYPGVSAVGLNGRQIGSAARRNPEHPVKPVTLASGASAVAVLQMVDVSNYPPSRCVPVSAAGLRVYPPNQIVSKLVPYPLRACSKSGAGFLAVEAVEAASAAPSP